MKEIKELSRDSGLNEYREWFSKWVPMDSYKLFKMCIYSSTLISIEVQWSCDVGEDKEAQFKIMMKSPSKHWKYVCKHVKLPFCRVKVENTSGLPNDTLKVIFLGVCELQKPKTVCFEKTLPICIEKNDIHSKSEPVGVIPVNEDNLSLDEEKSNLEREKTRRFSSPFSKRPKSTSVLSPAPNRKIPTRDCRLPDFVPKGSILVGDTCSNLKSLPYGLPNQVLTCGH